MSKIILFIGTMLVSLLVFPQKRKIDSLTLALQKQPEDSNRVKTLISLAEAENRANNYDNLLLHLSQAIAISDKLNYRKGKADALLLKAEYDGFGRFDNKAAIKGTMEAAAIFESIDDKPGLASAYNRSAIFKSNSEDMPGAIKDYYSELAIHEQMGKYPEAANSLAGIGFVYYWQGDYDQAFTILQQALTMALKAQEYPSYPAAIANIYIASIYVKRKQFTDAEKFNLTGLNLSKKIQDEQLIANALWVYGDINAERVPPDYPQALKNYLLAVHYFKIARDGGGLGDSYCHVATTYLNMGQLQNAQIYNDSARMQAITFQSKDIFSKSYLIQSGIDSAAGNYKKAYDHYKLFMLYRDSTQNENNTKRSLAAQTGYERSKEEALAREIQLKNEAAAAKAKSRQLLITWVSIIAVLATLIIAFIEHRNNKNKDKTNRLLNQQKQQVELTLTELKSTQAQLIQQEKMASLGELTAGIAHEIQNPLNFVNNFSEINTELLLELKDEIDKGNTEEAKAIANDLTENEQKINHHGKRADSIVKGMLQHSRNAAAVKEPTDINVLADEYLRLANHGLRAKDNIINIPIKTNYDATIGKINIIPQDIGRVILNMITNAFYTVNEKKKLQEENYDPLVILTTHKADHIVQLKITDNGNGIPQNLVDKIFQPFFTTKPTGQGIGLGLSLSYDIVKAHGGSIQVETREGEGTTFVVMLPNQT